MPALTLRDAYDGQAALCDQLEEIADSLPDRVSPSRCRAVADALVDTLRDVQAVEDLHVFRQIQARGSRRYEDLVEKLRLQQVADLCLAEEVQQELVSLAEGRPSMPPEAVGYMLRGFFDGLRRNMTHAQELLQLLEHSPPD